MPRGRPKRIIRKTIRRKCHHCGKMKTNPLVHHIVPPISVYGQIPIYKKGGEKTDRVDLKGNMKVIVRNYCDRDCKSKYSDKRVGMSAL